MPIIKPSTSPTQFPLKAVLVAICIGMAGGLALAAGLGRLSPGSPRLGAIEQASKALWSGQASAMAQAFSNEIALERSSGVYALPVQGVEFKLTFGAQGSLNSLSKFNPSSSAPCMLELAIDGSGDPSLRSSTFSKFEGMLSGADKALAPAAAMASAFTVAHELGHCDLHARPSDDPAKAFISLLASLSLPQDHEAEKAAGRYFHSRFGYVSFQESYADAMALIALSKRLSPQDFDDAGQMLLIKRRESAGIKELGGYPTPYQTHFAIPAVLRKGQAALAALQSPQSGELALRAASEGAALFLGDAQPDGSVLAAKAFPSSPKLATSVAAAARALIEKQGE